jgi:hypothetical protein
VVSCLIADYIAGNFTHSMASFTFLGFSFLLIVPTLVFTRVASSTCGRMKSKFLSVITFDHRSATPTAPCRSSPPRHA